MSDSISVEPDARPDGRRRGRSWSAHASFGSEWVVVLLMVASAVLSAIAFWHATSLSDEATELANQARFAAAESGKTQSAIQAKAAFDQRLLLSCVTATTRRDAALLEYSRTFDEDLVPTLIDSERTRVGQTALLLMDHPADCRDYNLESALEFESLLRRATGDASPEALLRRSAALSAGEPVALQAAVLFALALLLLTLADSTQRVGWVRLWLVAALVAFASATVLTAAAFADGGGLAPVMIVVPVCLLVVLFLTTLPIILTPLGAEPAIADPSDRAPARGARRRPWAHLDRSVRWWAEVLGAVTLVVFALSALGFSESSSLERQAIVKADQMTIDARWALDVGEQSALAVLTYVGQLSEVDASVAAAQGDRGSDPERDATLASQARKAVLARWVEEQRTWDRLVQSGRESARGESTCIADQALLAWHLTDVAGGSPLPELLLEHQRTDQTALQRILEHSAAPSIACEIRAAVYTDESQGWGARVSIFTVSLVVLGLAGFLFSLAADPDRSLRPRRWLLGAALIGLVVGVGITAVGAARRPPETPDAAAISGSTAYAASQAAYALGECERARSEAALAVDALEHFPRAYELEALAWSCSDPSLFIEPHLDREARDKFLAGMEEADRRRLGGSAAAGQLGWANILAGIAADGDARTTLLERAVDRTEVALDSDPTNPFMCFNLALATLALGRDDAAIELYRQAAGGLRHDVPDGVVGQRCEPDYEPFLQDYVILSALADLELLPDSGVVESLRGLLIDGRFQAGPAPAPPDLGKLTFFTYPQEIGVSSDRAIAGRISIVWYYLGSEDEPWTVLSGPSLATLAPGRHMGSGWLVGDLLPKGTYRADIYMNGRRTHSISTREDWWDRRNLDVADFERVEMPDLGIRATLPDDWKLLEHEAGIEVAMGGAGWHVAFRRTDGVDRQDFEARLASWTRGWISAWGVPWDAGAAVPEAITQYVMGLDDVALQAGGPGKLAGIGHTGYLARPEGIGFDASNLDDVTCSGTQITFVIASTDPNLAETIWSSALLASPVHTVNAADVNLASPFVSPLFSIEFDEDWSAIGCPGYFQASAREQDRNVIVSATPYAGDLSSFVETNLEVLRVESDYPKFTIESQRAVTLSNGVSGEQVRYTWTSPSDQGGVPVRQTQVYAVVDDLGYLLTFTTYADVGHDSAEFSRLRSSFRPGRR